MKTKKQHWCSSCEFVGKKTIEEDFEQTHETLREIKTTLKSLREKMFHWASIDQKKQHYWDEIFEVENKIEEIAESIEY